VFKRTELIGAAEYLTLYARCCINRCCYNRFRLSVLGLLSTWSRNFGLWDHRFSQGVLLRTQVFREVFTQRHNIVQWRT